MRFADLAATSAAVAATSKRTVKVGLLADALRRLGPEEIVPGAAYLSGELRQRQTGVGYASLQDLPPPAGEATLSVGQVDAALDQIRAESGPGSQGRRRDRLGQLFAAATLDEQRMLRGLLAGELRQGAQAGLLADAIARAAGIDAAQVRRALLLSGDLTMVARVALTEGAGALGTFALTLGRPLAPMLAQSAPSVAEALAITGMPAMVDAKLDGVRIQAHKRGDQVALFSRSLDDLTGRMPGIAAAVRALPVDEVVLDGEAMALDAAGRPRPFQETASIASTQSGVDIGGLTPYFFDVLQCDGTVLVDEPGHIRWAALAEFLPVTMAIERTEATDLEAGERAFADAIRAHQEGVVVKTWDAPYDVGRRGGAWVKVKPRHTLDLVVLAVEWGHGRRRGLLSNLHLGARDPVGGFVMLGKTFKGLTDAMLRWQTERFLALATDRSDWVVTLRPEQVVEVAFDGVQSSPRYPGGVALRFARVIRYRDDKTAAEADTIDTVRDIHARGHLGQID
jgi:DNA ligase-1